MSQRFSLSELEPVREPTQLLYLLRPIRFRLSNNYSEGGSDSGRLVNMNEELDSEEVMRAKLLEQQQEKELKKNSPDKAKKNRKRGSGDQAKDNSKSSKRNKISTPDSNAVLPDYKDSEEEDDQTTNNANSVTKQNLNNSPKSGQMQTNQQQPAANCRDGQFATPESLGTARENENAPSDLQMTDLIAKIKQVPKLETDKSTIAVWVQCGRADGGRKAILELLHKDKNLRTNIFRKIIVPKDESLLLVILNEKDHRPTLDTMLKDTRAVVHEQNPMKANGLAVILVDFNLNPISQALLKRAILDRNLISEDFVVTKVYAKQPTCAVIQAHSRETYDQLKQLKSVYIGDSTAEVHLFCPIRLCSSCCQFGHTVGECPYPAVRICVRCGETDHVVQDCMGKPICCFNCKIAGYPHNHLASTISCRHRLAIMKQECSKQ